jgi:hypothetical protein
MILSIPSNSVITDKLKRELRIFKESRHIWEAPAPDAVTEDISHHHVRLLANIYSMGGCTGKYFNNSRRATSLKSLESNCSGVVDFNRWVFYFILISKNNVACIG